MPEEPEENGLRRFIRTPIGIFLIAAVTFAAGWICAVQRFRTPEAGCGAAAAASTAEGPVRLHGFTFISPILLCSSAKKDFAGYEPLKEKVTKAVNERVEKKDAEKVSVYFRELESSHWTGVNENDSYEPASLLKVPFLMAYYKKAEEDPGILSQEFSYDGAIDEDENEYYRAPVMEKGKNYSVDELITRMIAYSGNNSLHILSKNIDAKSVTDVYTDLGVTVPSDTTQKAFMTPKLYSSFFRVLYNASYLSRDSSERALDLLSKTTFTQGLVAGVPEGTVVAHKFGERPITSETDPSEMTGAELHDCGIVYYPKNPYVLCVMTRGKDFDKLAATIANISRTVYDEVDGRKIE